MKYLRTAKYSLFLLLFCCSAFFALAQEKTITGKVVSDDGPPLSGVSVSSKGATKSVVTDSEGKFTITVTGNDAILFVSHVGFLSKDVNVGTNNNINITLFKSDKAMDDVVVIGYGAKKRANVLGSVGTVNPKEIEDLPVANLATALVNKVPGVSISQSSGKPGSSTSLRIRNPTTFGTTGSINPLYVIDGIAYNEPEGKEFFDNMDATMVESISFLKDAAASIYGSRGANGVVLITTKKGRPGKPRVSYTGSYGLSMATDLPEILSAYDHATLLNNKYSSRSDWNQFKYTTEEMEYLKTHNYDWLDAVWENGTMNRHTVNVTGGSDKISFFAGANYLKETGNLQDLYATRYGFRIGMNAKITENLSADISFSNDNAIQDRPTPKGISAFAGQNSDQNDEMNATIGALMLIPKWVPMYIDGQPVFTTAPGWHPREVQNTNTYSRTNSRGQNITASLNYKIPMIDGLSFRVSYGQNSRNSLGKEYYVSYNLYDFQRINYSPLSGSGVTKQAVIFTNQPTASNPVRAIRNGNSLRTSSDMAKSYQFNQSLNYQKTIGKHSLDVLVLAEQSESSTEGFFSSVEGQVIPGVDELWGFTSDKTAWDHASSSTETGRASYLGRLNYSFDDKYLLEGVLRADASPNFPPGSRWGYFPSIAVGWKVSQEEFFINHVPFINDLKIRFQVGLTGSDAVANYQYYERYTQTTGMLFGSTMTNGLNNNRIPNPNITWEKALYKNLGFDGTFFNRKFNFAIDLYHRHNTDMLQSSSSTVPTTLGVAIADQNYAEMKSWGVEGALGYNGKITRDLTYSVQVNAGWADNKVLQKFYGAADTGWKNPIGRRTDNGIEGLTATGIFRTQEEVDDFMAKNPGWTIDGQVPRVGFMNFQDVDGDGRITATDRARIAPRSGSIFGAGFNLGLAWKGLKFSVNTSLSIGGSRLYDNSARRPPTENQSALSLWKDSWSPENPNAKYPVIYAPYASEASTMWMVNGTLMRINNMQLSYALPATLSSKLKIPEFRAFLVATNIGDIINNQPYKSSFSNVAVDYPALRTITLGVNVSL
jgi:TonB-dependent starch-binding outer membrane protein SusC